MTSESDDWSYSDEFGVDDRARFSLMGMMRFDAEAVAATLRDGKIGRLGLIQLANMLDGTHSMGLRLVMQGQGKGWKPIYEKAQAYDRAMRVGRFFDRRREAGCSYEEAKIDAAERFGLSEPTIARDLQLYRLAQEAEE